MESDFHFNKEILKSFCFFRGGFVQPDFDEETGIDLHRKYVIQANEIHEVQENMENITNNNVYFE